jgi:hypothetical protein
MWNPIKRGEATNRSRYDTQALVTEIKKERRNALILGAAGVAIAAILVVLYFAQVGGGDEPSSPAGRAAMQAREGTKPPAMGVPDAGPGATTPAVTAPAPTPPPIVDTPVIVKAVLTRKTALWIDGKAITHGKDIATNVQPGMHEVKLKVGKRSSTQKVDFKAGAEYELRFDPKSNKVLLKKLK